MKLCSRCQRKLKDCARLTPSSHRTCWITVLYSVCNRNTFTVILHGYFHSTMAILKPSLGLDSFDKQVTQSLGPSSWPHLYATTIMRQVSKLVQPTIPSTLKVQTNTIFQITKITHIWFNKTKPLKRRAQVAIHFHTAYQHHNLLTARINCTRAVELYMMLKKFNVTKTSTLILCAATSKSKLWCVCRTPQMLQNVRTLRLLPRLGPQCGFLTLGTAFTQWRTQVAQCLQLFHWQLHSVNTVCGNTPLHLVGFSTKVT